MINVVDARSNDEYHGRLFVLMRSAGRMARSRWAKQCVGSDSAILCRIHGAPPPNFCCPSNLSSCQAQGLAIAVKYTRGGHESGHASHRRRGGS